jgi:putative transcriptional regulator
MASKASAHGSDSRVLAELGERLARRRLDRNLTQAQLAREAGVSKRTLLRLEQGQSSQLTNFVRVLRALQLLDELIAVVPSPLASPLAQLATRRRERRRASPARKANAPKTPWTWGDEHGAKGKP